MESSFHPHSISSKCLWLIEQTHCCRQATKKEKNTPSDIKFLGKIRFISGILERFDKDSPRECVRVQNKPRILRRKGKNEDYWVFLIDCDSAEKSILTVKESRAIVALCERFRMSIESGKIAWVNTANIANYREIKTRNRRNALLMNVLWVAHCCIVNSFSKTKKPP